MLNLLFLKRKKKLGLSLSNVTIIVWWPETFKYDKKRRRNQEGAKTFITALFINGNQIKRSSVSPLQSSIYSFISKCICSSTEGEKMVPCGLHCILGMRGHQWCLSAFSSSSLEDQWNTSLCALVNVKSVLFLYSSVNRVSDFFSSLIVLILALLLTLYCGFDSLIRYRQQKRLG